MPEQVIIGEVVVHHEGVSDDDGRRVVAYERAGSDEGGTTDLGRKTRRWRIRGFVISAAERDKLSALLDEARRVRFRHSSGAIFQVRIESLRKSRDSLGDVYPVEIGLVLAEQFRATALTPAAEVRAKSVLAWSAVGGNAEDGGTEAAPLFHRRAREMREAAADPRIFAARAVAARREDLTREAADAAERAGGLAGALEVAREWSFAVSDLRGVYGRIAGEWSGLFYAISRLAALFRWADAPGSSPAVAAAVVDELYDFAAKPPTDDILGGALADLRAALDRVELADEARADAVARTMPALWWSRRTGADDLDLEARNDAFNPLLMGPAVRYAVSRVSTGN